MPGGDSGSRGGIGSSIQDLAVEGHLDDSRWTRFHMHALTEDGFPLLVALVEADLEDETGVTHPQEFVIVFSDQRDAVSFGQTGLHRPRTVTVPVERHQLPGVKTDQLSGRSDDNPVVRP